MIINGEKVRHLHEVSGRYYWIPSRAAKLQGFHNEPLGADIGAAAKRAIELNSSYDLSRAEAPLDHLIAPDLCKHMKRMLGNSRTRAERKGLEWALNYRMLAEMMVRQKCRCAITDVPFSLEKISGVDSWRRPFAPSLDRIEGKLGYVAGNVRLLCVMTNIAINEWGEGAFYTLIAALRRKDASRAATTGTEQSV